MRCSDSGAGRGKTILAVAILAAIAYVAIKTIPVYVNNYQLQDYLREVAVQATVNRSTAEVIRDNVVAHARDLGLPLTRDNVKVQAGNRVIINVDYTVPIDLKVYTLTLHFTPSADNRGLL